MSEAFLASKRAILRFLARAAYEFRDSKWVFTGFHWPVVAAHMARRLEGRSFTQVFEAGAACNAPTRKIPTSTTDYAAYDGSACFLGSTADVLFGLARRLDVVMLDASNVDVSGRINSWGIGPVQRPSVRLSGGGGAPDVAAKARHLVLLQGSGKLLRVQKRVEHVTASPNRDASVTLITQFGVIELGLRRLVEHWDHEDAGKFMSHLQYLGIDTANSREWQGGEDNHVLEEAQQTLIEAAERGYVAARHAIGEP